MTKNEAAEKQERAGRPPTGEVVTCKFCSEEIPIQQLSSHLWSTHGMTLQEYETWYPGKPRPKVIEIGTYERIPPPPPGPPPEPEPTIEIRLADVATNPRFESVQGRRGTTYNLQKHEWTPVRVQDAWIITGSDTIPSKYPYLTFEKREPRKRRGKAKAK